MTNLKFYLELNILCTPDIIGKDCFSVDTEIASILQNLARHVQNGSIRTPRGITTRNGSPIGTVRYTEEDSSDAID